MMNIPNRSRAVPAAATDASSYQQMLTDAGNVQEELSAASAGAAAENENGNGMPMNREEAYQMSWKALLANNVGRRVVVSFLMGTQQTVVAEGVLYEVGSDYIVLYQPSRDSYITADLYSVKFVEFRVGDQRAPSL